MPQVKLVELHGFNLTLFNPKVKPQWSPGFYCVLHPQQEVIFEKVKATREISADNPPSGIYNQNSNLSLTSFAVNTTAMLLGDFMHTTTTKQE